MLLSCVASDRGTHQTMTNDISMSIGPCVNYLELAGEYIYNLNVPISHFLNVSIFKPRHLVTVVFNCEADKYKKKLDVFFIFTIITNYRLWFHNQLTIYVCRIMCIMKYIDSGLCIVTIQKSVLWLVWKFNFVALSIWLNHEDI